MSDRSALIARRIFDGEIWREDAALVLKGDRVEAITSRDDLPPDLPASDLGEAFLAPGFIDLQVNGGGGVMFNDRRDVEAIRTICAAHAPFGTTAVLVTLITDTPEITSEAIAAGVEAARVPGFLGLHLEGPHLALSRKGAHDPRLIRRMEETDVAKLIAARKNLHALMTTVATESVTADQIRRLAQAGVVVSLGHSDASYEDAAAAVEAGASMATHLFNAMSQIGNRAPGLTGAAIDLGGIWAGLIADGVHVDQTNIGLALRAKRGPGRIFLVTDAMSTIGSDITEFTLNGRVIKRENGRLTLADGTLAGADLDMISAVRFMRDRVGLPVEEALRMASLYPAQSMGLEEGYGRLTPNGRADIVALTDDLRVSSVWIAGKKAV
jgi:N-acetylglucosamine-6-phosphate deacetylase